MQDASIEAQNMAAAADSAAVNIEAIGTTSKAATVATKAFTAAGNMLLMFGISEAISITATEIDKLVHSLENSRKAAEEALSAINESNSSIKSNGEWIESNISKYERLSKGIDALGRNVSLTDEEFQEYNSLTNEIAEMFPALVTGYTDTGDAILSCKNNVDLLTQAYEEQKQAAKDAIFQNSEELFNGFKADTTGRNPFSNGALSKSDELDIVNDLLNGKKVTDEVYANQTSVVLKNAGIELSGFNLNAKKLNTVISQNQKTLAAYARTLESSMESATSNITPIIEAYLDTNIDFNKYDAETQAYIKQIADNMGYRFYSEFENETDLVNWIDNVLVPAFQDADSQDLLSDLFTIDKDSIPASEYVKEIARIIKEIAEKIGGDEDQIKIKLGFDFIDTEQELIDQVKDKISGNVGSATAGVTNAISEAIKKANNQVAVDWVDSLSEEELELANSDEFDNALEKQKENLNGAILSAKDYEAALQTVKDAQEQLDTNTKQTDSFTLFTEDQSEAIDDFQSKVTTLSDALSALRSGSVGNGAFTDLIQEFPELEGQSSNLEQAIQTSPCDA